VDFDEHDRVGIVPPVQNGSLSDRRSLGIRAKEVDEHLDIRRLSSEGRRDQEEEREDAEEGEMSRSGCHG